MMSIIIAISVFSLAFLLMAVGVIFSDRVIKGSCGGIGVVMGDDAKVCDCGKKRGSCGE